MKTNLKMQLLVAMIAAFTATNGWAQTPLTTAGVENISGCTLIDRLGSYVLTKDITAKTPDLKSVTGNLPACILIIANFVSLDLAGHTITGPDSGLVFTSMHL